MTPVCKTCRKQFNPALKSRRQAAARPSDVCPSCWDKYWDEQLPHDPFAGREKTYTNPLWALDKPRGRLGPRVPPEHLGL